MELGSKADLLEIGKKAMAEKGKEGRDTYLKGLSQNDKPSIQAELTPHDNDEDPPAPFTPTPQPVNTQKEIAKA